MGAAAFFLGGGGGGGGAFARRVDCGGGGVGGGGAFAFPRLFTALLGKTPSSFAAGKRAQSFSPLLAAFALSTMTSASALVGACTENGGALVSAELHAGALSSVELQ